MESIFKHLISRMAPLYERKCEEGRTRRCVILVYFLTISNLECAHSNVGSERCFKTGLEKIAHWQGCRRKSVNKILVQFPLF